MRSRLFLIALSLSMFFFGLVGGAVSAFQRCLLCGMDVERSETAFYAKMSNGKPVPLCSMKCVCLLEMNSSEEVASVRTEIFPVGLLSDAKSAYFLCESRLVPKGSMAPYVAAFSSKEEAEEYRRKYGGRILEFKEPMAFVRQSITRRK